MVGNLLEFVRVLFAPVINDPLNAIPLRNLRIKIHIRRKVQKLLSSGHF
jgi:hypothetical protein